MDVLKEDFLLVPPFFGDLLFFAGLLLLDLVTLPVFVRVCVCVCVCCFCSNLALLKECIILPMFFV